jgi:ureidoglycolate lyase
MRVARTLKAEPLTQAGFAPYGELVMFDQERAYPVNAGRALRCDTPVRIDADAEGGKAVLAVYRAAAEFLPTRLTLFECHPHSSQTFVCLSAVRFLVVVATPDAGGAPDMASMRAFIGGPGQGVNYRRGLWHAPIKALDAEGDFAMLIWERGSPEDCLLHSLMEPIDVEA